MRARLLAVAALPLLSACSLLLDFDLTGGSGEPSAQDAATIPEAGAAPDASEDDAGRDASPDAPPFPALDCSGPHAICDGFERDALDGGPFGLVSAGPGRVEIQALLVGAESRSLQITAPASSGPEGVLTAAQDLPFGGPNHAVALSFVMFFSGAPFTGSRTLLSVAPFGSIAPLPARERMWLELRDGVPTAVVRKVDADGKPQGEASVALPELTPNAWHRLDVSVRFHDQNGRLKVAVDLGAPHEAPNASKTARANLKSERWSLALSASATSAASPVQSTFDNVFGSAQ